MRNPAATDAAFATLYADVRNRLLLQTWALTGDLPSAHKAVREAFVIAAHHWRKVRLLIHPSSGDGRESQEDWVRPIAWRHAQRRQSVPHLHRDKDLDQGIRDTLAALAKLTITQRKVLLLAHLSSVTIDQLAREVGITKSRAERELQSATAAFSVERDVATTSILSLFEPMGAVVAAREWPPAEQLTRAGGHRRLTHTVAGAAAALVALVGSGVLVTHQADSQPSLGALTFTETETPEPAPAPEPEPLLEGADLLQPQELGAALKGSWRTELTSDNKGGSGLLLPCQQRRFADQRADAALMRSFLGTRAGDTAGQAVEVSPTPQAAKQAYDRALRWYSGCASNRIQLIRTEQVTGLGDAAQLIAVRDWNSRVSSTVVGVARTGNVTTQVTATLPVTPEVAVPRVRVLLSDAVGHACEIEGAGACLSRQTATPVPPAAIGKHPFLLGEIDLPPVPRINRPWLGTTPERARTNQAATRCDNTSFAARPVTDSWTRTFVIPGARGLDRAFGLTETVGSFANARGAARFLETVRGKLAACSERDLVSTVTGIGEENRRDRQVAAWRVEVQTSETASVTYLMAIVRQDNHVAQIGFVPSGGTTLTEDQFTWLTSRAADRLTLR